MVGNGGIVMSTLERMLGLGTRLGVADKTPWGLSAPEVGANRLRSVRFRNQAAGVWCNGRTLALGASGDCSIRSIPTRAS